MALLLRPLRSVALSVFISSMGHCRQPPDGCHRGFLGLPCTRLPQQVQGRVLTRRLSHPRDGLHVR